MLDVLMERYPWADAHCLSKKGVTRDYKEEWEAYRYLVGGKMFVMLGGDKYNEPIITVKLEPLFGDTLRREYKDIIPGHYMNKQHWNSVYLKGDVPDDLLRSMLDKSYEAVLGGLSKKAQAEILSG